MSDFDDVVTVSEERQVILTEAIVNRFGLEPGDRLVVEADETMPDRVYLRRLRRSYAGILDGVYGTDEEALAYVRAERASWDDRSLPDSVPIESEPGADQL